MTQTSIGEKERVVNYHIMESIRPLKPCCCELGSHCSFRSGDDSCRVSPPRQHVLVKFGLGKMPDLIKLIHQSKSSYFVFKNTYFDLFSCNFRIENNETRANLLFNFHLPLLALVLQNLLNLLKTNSDIRTD